MCKLSKIEIAEGCSGNLASIDPAPTRYECHRREQDNPSSSSVSSSGCLDRTVVARFLLLPGGMYHPFVRMIACIDHGLGVDVFVELPRLQGCGLDRATSAWFIATLMVPVSGKRWWVKDETHLLVIIFYPSSFTTILGEPESLQNRSTNLPYGPSVLGFAGLRGRHRYCVLEYKKVLWMHYWNRQMLIFQRNRLVALVILPGSTFIDPL